MSDKITSRPGKRTGGDIPRLKELPSDLDAELFVATWNSAQTLASFAGKIGVAASTCADYARRLRQAGYALKTFQRGRPRLLKM